MFEMDIFATGVVLLQILKKGWDASQKNQISEYDPLLANMLSNNPCERPSAI